MTAREDKKELIIDKAVGIFAELGYYKATTASVAKAAGVTQPYVFHFFTNKEELYKAVLDRAMSRIKEAFEKVDAPASELEEKMGKAFLAEMQVHRDEVLLVMQSHSISEPAIRNHVRELFKSVHGAIRSKFLKANIPNVEWATSRFMATGYLITVSEVLDLAQYLCLESES
ncbi:TetR/AcrR family transcriptional regulator [Paenibacillus sp. LjRoot153]|uniref:TetR/AcrR family transcriptional regulator n=1 Tax=Paenibacillus sp. LjRoot153 TaxID=3342270 RepID=UPI003ECF8BAF